MYPKALSALYVVMLASSGVLGLMPNYSLAAVNAACSCEHTGSPYDNTCEAWPQGTPHYNVIAKSCVGEKCIGPTCYTDCQEYRYYFSVTSEGFAPGSPHDPKHWFEYFECFNGGPCWYKVSVTVDEVTCHYWNDDDGYKLRTEGDCESKEDCKTGCDFYDSGATDCGGTSGDN